MTENFFYSLNAILPIFLLVIVGVILKKAGRVNDSFTNTADWLVFKIGLPIMLFLEVASCDFNKQADFKLIVFCIVSVTASFVVISVLTSLFVKDKSKRGALAQGMYRSNFAILGVPLAVNMFGESGGQTIALVMPFIILMFNAYSVILLSVFASKNENRFSSATIKTVLKNIVTNPLIIGVVFAVPFMIFKIDIPIAVNKTLTYLSNLATPLALISLGANFKRESLRGRIGYAIYASLVKTVILPAIALSAAVLAGLRGPSLGVILICFGSPTAVSSYIMAKKMGNDHELAGQILLISTLMCIITIFAGIFILKSTALI